MPPEMSVSMRHTKLKASEAALLAGELSKPSWESRNEGIHERVSFEDSIWGFDLAGGSFYKTPLRVTHVKADSRAEKAGIRPGDKLKRINDIDTSTLTIQEAHKIIIESGIHLKIAVTAPEDEEDSYHCYEDPLETGYDSEEERRLEEEKARKRQVHARVSSYWSLQWPWVSKRRVIYRESNCFMVPSKYEDKHRDKFPTQPHLRVEDSISIDSINPNKQNKRVVIEETVTENGVDVTTQKSNVEELKTAQTLENANVDSNNNSLIVNDKEKHVNGRLNEIVENEHEIENHDEVEKHKGLENDEELTEEQTDHNDENDVSIEENSEETKTSEVNEHPRDDEVIEELLDSNEHDISETDDDKVLDSILSDSEEHDNTTER